MDDQRLDLVRRLLAEAARRKLGATAVRDAFEAELAAMAERLTATGGPLPREEASIAERFAALMYLPQSSEAETEREAKELAAWLASHGYGQA
jgi:hypothetical protein